MPSSPPGTSAKPRRASSVQVAIAKKTGNAIDLNSMKWDQYERVSDHGKPSGCTEGCPCRATGIHSTGDTATICTNPKRFRQLKSVDTRAENARKKAEIDAACTRLTAHLAEIEEIPRRFMAIVAAHALTHAGEPELKALADALELKLKASGYSSQVQAENLTELAKLSVPDQIKLVAEAILRTEIRHSIESQWLARTSLKFYTEIAGQAPAAATAKSDEEPIDSGTVSCCQCGDQLHAADVVFEGADSYCHECAEEILGYAPEDLRE